MSESDSRPASYQNDLQLFTALSKGEWSAMRVLYDRYWDELIRHAYQKIQSWEVAEELVQDLFVEIWQRRETLQVRQVESYLFTAIKYAVIDYIRSRAGRSEFLEYQESFAESTGYIPDDELSYQDLVEQIEAELGRMPDKTQEVFRLSRFEGRSIPEISHQLNLSGKTIEYHLSKALKVLREHLHLPLFSALAFLLVS